MMGLIVDLFHLVITQPLLNALVFLYQTIPGQDFGAAVIVLTLAIRFLFYPLGAKAVRAQKKMAAIQPKLEELKKEHKDDREGLAKATMALYKEEGVNPFSSIVPLLVQIPVLIGMYRVFIVGFGEEQLERLYGFVPHPGTLDTSFLGLVDLSEGSLVMAVLAGATMFVQSKQSMRDSTGGGDFAKAFRGQMTYLFPVFIAFIVTQLPSAIGLYFITTTLFAIWQHWQVGRAHAR